MNIQGVQQQLRDFATARDWQPSHSPKNLAMALMVEAAELLELFQWLTTEQSHTLTKVSEDKAKVADEIADVMLYLLQIADRTGVNLEEAVQKKIVKNTEKYPAKHPEALSSKSKVHLLVDWENVQPDAQALKQLEPEGSDVWLFHAPAQYLAAQKQQKAYGSNSVTLVERSGAGKNALDFQLSYYAGYLMARQPEARFVVISNDKGYEPMLEHARKLKFQAQRQGYQKPPAVKAVKVQAPPVAKVAAQKNQKNNNLELLKQSRTMTSLEPSAGQIAYRLIKVLRELPAQQRPKLWQELVDLALSKFHGAVIEPLSLAQKAARLLIAKRVFVQDASTGGLSYQLTQSEQSPQKLTSSVNADVVGAVA